MQRNRWSLQDAKNKFSEVVEAAVRGRPQFVTRRGREAVVVVSSADYERLGAQLRPAKPSIKDHLLSMPVPDDGEPIEFERIKLAPRDIDP